MWCRSKAGGAYALTLSIIVFALLLSPAPAAAYAYTAEGTWSTEDGQLTGTWQASFDMAGDDIGGFMIVTGLPGVHEGQFLGLLRGKQFDFTLSRVDQEYATFSGTIGPGHFIGVFNPPDGAHGSWQGFFSPSTS